MHSPEMASLHLINGTESYSRAINTQHMAGAPIKLICTPTTNARLWGSQNCFVNKLSI
jgi:hypothetical protein